MFITEFVKRAIAKKLSSILGEKAPELSEEFLAGDETALPYKKTSWAEENIFGNKANKLNAKWQLDSELDRRKAAAELIAADKKLKAKKASDLANLREKGQQYRDFITSTGAPGLNADDLKTLYRLPLEQLGEIGNNYTKYLSDIYSAANELGRGRATLPRASEQATIAQDADIIGNRAAITKNNRDISNDALYGDIKALADMTGAQVAHGNNVYQLNNARNIQASQDLARQAQNADNLATIDLSGPRYEAQRRNLADQQALRNAGINTDLGVQFMRGPGGREEFSLWPGSMQLGKQPDLATALINRQIQNSFPDLGQSTVNNEKIVYDMTGRKYRLETTPSGKTVRVPIQ